MGPHADLMFATIIYNVTGAHLALTAIILLRVDHTHAWILLHSWTLAFFLPPCLVPAPRERAQRAVCGFTQHG